jgi:lysophospholipase L1-like esterase
MADLRDVPILPELTAVEYRGAVEVVRTAIGVQPLRLPRWTEAQHPDRSVTRQGHAGSGIRLAFRTAATVLELDVLTTVSSWDPPTHAGVFDLCVDGVLTATLPAPIGTTEIVGDARIPGAFTPGAVGTVRFEGLPPGVKEIELWLPQWVATEIAALRADAGLDAPAPTGRRRWLHHGSSISQSNEADSPTGVWPVVAARRAGVEVTNLGLSGNCHLDPFVARAIRDVPDLDLVSLKIGINIVRRRSLLRRTFGPAVHGFLDLVRDGHPDCPILVVSPIACPDMEDAELDEFRADAGVLTLAIVREELRALVEARDDARLHYRDGRDLLGPDEGHLLRDGLHPSPEGYRLIGERFAELAFGEGGPFGAGDVAAGDRPFATRPTASI